MGTQADTGKIGTMAARSWAIIALLVFIVLLVLGMALQAQRSADAHNQTAVGVLHDYAQLAADEFARRAMAATGYYGYYTAINELRDAEGDQLTVGGPARYVFRHNFETGGLAVASGESLAPELYSAIGERVQHYANSPLPQAGFVIDHTLVGGEQHTFVITWNDPATEALGFEADRDWLHTTLQSAFDEKALLPPSLANGALSNELLYVRMDDSAGRTLFETGELLSDTVLVKHALADEYNGVFAAHTISVSMGPQLAESLVIGGLPKSRLPLFLAVVLLAIGLLFVAVWQLQRENAVMQLRSDFVAEVSHELRTPLTQIRMFTESLLLRRLSSAEDRSRALSIINREAQRLIHMVENILRFSENERQAELAPQRQAIAPILISVVDEFQVLANAAEATITTNIDDAVEANIDADAIRQVILNLLDNAIKYGPRGQTVHVELQAVRDTIHITVADAGPGIPESERQRIFAGYYRLDRERDSAIAGTGIGLSVVGDIVRQHGGSVHVEDAENGGARFVVELPR